MHRGLGLTVASLAMAGVLFGLAGSLSAESGSVGSIRGTLKAYTSHDGSEVATSVSKGDMRGQPILSEQNGRYQIGVGGANYWVDKHQVSIDRDLKVPRACQNLATDHAGNSVPRSAGHRCEE